MKTALAESVLLNIADKRDPDKVYHLMDLTALKAFLPQRFDWAQLLREEGLPET